MPRCIWRSRCLTTSTPRRVESSSESDCPAVVVGRVRRSRHPAKWRVRRSRHPAKWRHNRKCPCSHYVWQDHNVWQGYNLYVNSGQIALPVDLLRYVSYGAGSAQGAPPVPPGSGQQNRRCAVPSTYPCRLRVGPRQRPCKTRPSARIHAGCPGLPGTSQRF